MRREVIRGSAARISAGVLSSLFLTWIAFQLRFNLSAATSAHLLLVTVIAQRWGFLEASLVSLLSVACLDYYFTEPIFAFAMADSHDWIALATFEGVALLVSRNSGQMRVQTRQAEAHRTQLQKLYELSQNVLLLDQGRSVDQQLASLIRNTLKADGVALWNSYEMRLSRSGNCIISDDEVRSTYFSERNEDAPDLAFSQRVLRHGTRAIGALVICGHSLDAATVQAVASLTAVAMERTHSFAARTTAEAARQSEQLRSAVLDGLAHAFKTPLTAIRSASSGLLQMNTLAGTEQRLVTLIDQHVDQLNDLTTRLLRTAKLDSVDLKAKRDPIDLAQLVRASIDTATLGLNGHPIQILATVQTRTVWADSQLLQMALLLLLDNAAKYSSPGSSITVNTQEDLAETLISVHNEGSFIPHEERIKIFQRFYRCPGSDHRASGTGIGLSVVKRITEAHHGRAWVESDSQTGTTFFIALPQSTAGNRNGRTH